MAPDPAHRNGAGGARAAERARLVLRSEFGTVAVEVCGAPGRERLRISDLRSEAHVELDPLELESLAWASHHDLATLLDPSATRWRPEDDATLAVLNAES